MDELLDITRLNRRIAIALQNKPGEVCGLAYRIGRTGKGDGDSALYRLRLNANLASFGKTTLPGLFILENGVFVEYVQSAQEETQVGK